MFCTFILRMLFSHNAVIVFLNHHLPFSFFIHKSVLDVAFGLQAFFSKIPCPGRHVVKVPNLSKHRFLVRHIKILWGIIKGYLPFKFDIFRQKTRTFVVHKNVTFRALSRHASSVTEKKIEISKKIKRRASYWRPHDVTTWSQHSTCARF